MTALSKAEEDEVAQYEDLRSCANWAKWTIELQVRRLREFVRGGVVGTEFVLQPVSDAEFLILALHRLLAVSRQIQHITGALDAAIAEYERAIPNLHKARNVVAHIDKYLGGHGRDKSVRVGSLRAHAFDDDRIDFAGFEFDLKAAALVSEQLFAAIRSNPPESYRRAVAANRAIEFHSGPVPLDEKR